MTSCHNGCQRTLNFHVPGWSVIAGYNCISIGTKFEESLNQVRNTALVQSYSDKLLFKLLTLRYKKCKQVLPNIHHSYADHVTMKETRNSNKKFMVPRICKNLGPCSLRKFHLIFFKQNRWRWHWQGRTWRFFLWFFVQKIFGGVV